MQKIKITISPPNTYFWSRSFFGSEDRLVLWFFRCPRYTHKVHYDFVFIDPPHDISQTTTLIIYNGLFFRWDEKGNEKTKSIWLQNQWKNIKKIVFHWFCDQMDFRKNKIHLVAKSMEKYLKIVSIDFATKWIFVFSLPFYPDSVSSKK